MFSFGKKKSTLTQADALKALAKIPHPSSGKDLVSANAIKDLRVANGSVALTLPLTAPSASLKQTIERDLKAMGAQHVSVNVELSIPADQRLMATTAIGVKNAIAIASGKGGVGKSTVAANLAVALAQMGAAVGLLDGDLYGPNIPMMLGITGQPIAMGGKMIPLSGHGVRVMSMGMLVEAGTPVIWRGPMLSQAIQQFLTDVLWGTLDYLIIDLPPGTGDVQLSLSQAMPLTGSLIVTTPQAVALADVIKGIAMFQQVEVSILGIVENMSYYVCPDCGRKEELFGSGGGAKMAQQFKLPLLGQVPFDARVRSGGDEGQPVVVRAPASPAAQVLMQIAETLALKISTQNLSAPKKHRPILSPELKFMG